MTDMILILYKHMKRHGPDTLNLDEASLICGAQEDPTSSKEYNGCCVLIFYGFDFPIEDDL